MLYMLCMPQCVADTASMCWYCYSADTVTLICMLSILHAQCSVLDQYIFHYCVTLKLCSWNHALLKLNKSSILSNTLKSFKTYSLQKTKQFQHDMFSNNLHNLNLNRKTYSNTLNQLTPFTHASILKHHW
jgi:hypothetical protein